MYGILEFGTKLLGNKLQRLSKQLPFREREKKTQNRIQREYEITNLKGGRGEGKREKVHKGSIGERERQRENFGQHLLA